LIDEYERPSVPASTLYTIDKVVRLRGLQGRYGVDHSEILQFEFEQANRDKFDTLNRLAYKDPETYDKENNRKHSYSLNKTRSNALFERLTEKELDELRRAGMNPEQLLEDNNRVRFTEWIRRKDAERRMRQKLIKEAREDIRQEVYTLAQMHEEDL
jgi:hypothetical protein